MAAPSKTARIGLLLENPSLENSWFLVDFTKHTCVQDVASEIKEYYFKPISNDLRVVLRINNFLLPPNGSSELFRENDIVSVRLEPSDCSVQECEATTLKRKRAPSLGENNAKYLGTADSKKNQSSKKHKRKKIKAENLSQNEDRLSGEKQDSHKAKKSKRKEKYSNTETEFQSITSVQNEHCIAGGDVLLNEDEFESKKCKAKLKKLKKNSESIKALSTSASTSHDVENSIKDDNAIAADFSVVETFTDIQVEESQVGPDTLSLSNQTSTSVDAPGKRKRKRIRKRKTKSSSKDSMDTSPCLSRINATLQRYAGTEVDKNDGGFYGALPDKLEPPKYYRHGYRNLSAYEVESNKHKRFGKDSESENEEESTQQYNFLCKSRKISEADIVNDEKSAGNFDFSEKVNNDLTFSNENQTSAFLDSQNTSYTENGFDEKYEEMYNVNKDSERNGQSELNYSNSYTAVPLNYGESSDQGIKETRHNNTQGSEISKASPVTLERKTLTNGVSVFVRQRPNPGSRFRELSKQEQLDTTVTNISTIFMNPPASLTQKSSPKASSPMSENCSMQAKSEMPNGTNFTDLKPLVGTPNPGDTIAYKVLEISASCTPEISDYKVATVLSVDDRQMLELKLLNKPDKEKNKFHIEIEDGDEILTNTASEEDIVCLHQSSLLQPGIISTCIV